VIDVALLSIIRRWHIRDQVPLREIARRLRISRNTVRRYLRAEITEPAYAVRRSRSAIDKYAFQLSAMLKTEAARSRKQRRTLKQIHEDLRELGFEGSYDRVAAFARVWRRVKLSGSIRQANEHTGIRKAARTHWPACCKLHTDLVILDELGYLPFSQTGGALLFHLISKLYEKTSLIITTNLGFAEWGGVWGREDDDCASR
jgi:AraC-like DNA-binding protein